MAYFKLTAGFDLNPEITNIRKNNVHRLLDVAQAIQNGNVLEGVSFFVNKKQVTASEYADEVMRVHAEYDNKFRETHKRIWIQQGVLGNSGYYKWIKAA